MKVTVEPVRAPLRAPFATAWGTISERDLLLVRLEDRDGAAGWGEAAPLPGYGGASAEQVQAALAAYRRVLAGADAPRAELLVACTESCALPEALAAIDLALWDLEGRRRGQPVWSLLTQTEPAPVIVNATIAATDPAEVSRAIARARDAGFRCMKVKVGLGDDVAGMAAARSAGGEGTAIRIDANGAWSVDQALAALHALAPFGVELCEEPVHGLEQIAAVAAASTIPIALDETAAAPAALERRVCDAACLKVASSGGISGLLRRAAQARATGYRVYVASTLDGPLGIAAALHAAAAIRPELPCGLATLSAFADRRDPLPPRGGRITPPSGPGLGGGLLEWYV